MPQIAIRMLDRGKVKACKTALEKCRHFDKTLGVEKVGDAFIIYTNEIIDWDKKAALDPVDIFPELSEIRESVEVILIPNGKLANSHSARSSLWVATEETIKRLSERYPNLNDSDILSSVPQRYYKYGKFLLLSSGSFDDSADFKSLQVDNSEFSGQFYSTLAGIFDVSHIALNAPISGDDDNVMRKPTYVSFLYGEFTSCVTKSTVYNPSQAHFESELWATTRQNGIFQTWAPRYTMFSRGNIKEKARVQGFSNIKGKMSVDLYAGIGYFVFSYAKSESAQVLCWEINPWSVEGLMRGAKTNKWDVQLVRHDEKWICGSALPSRPKIVVFLEDNQCAAGRLETAMVQLGMKYNISHINLGLLPSSEQAWGTAIKLAWISSEDEIMLHVHANVAISDLDLWRSSTKSGLLERLQAFSDTSTITDVHVEKIKSFAPGVVHVCGDYLVKKPAEAINV